MHFDLSQLVRAPYYDKYIELVQETDLSLELISSKNLFLSEVGEIPVNKLSFSYASGKWTTAEVLLHIIETEVIFNYRALRISRDAKPEPLAGYDDERYMSAARKDALDLPFILEYFESVRNSTISMLKTLQSNDFQKRGLANSQDIQVAALFFVTSGHCRHHLNILKSKYLQ
ncbi:MAG: DinB family protein [Flavobacteriales bacterium]